MWAVPLLQLYPQIAQLALNKSLLHIICTPYTHASVYIFMIILHLHRFRVHIPSSISWFEKKKKYRFWSFWLSNRQKKPLWYMSSHLLVLNNPASKSSFGFIVFFCHVSILMQQQAFAFSHFIQACVLSCLETSSFYQSPSILWFMDIVISCGLLRGFAWHLMGAARRISFCSVCSCSLLSVQLNLLSIWRPLWPRSLLEGFLLLLPCHSLWSWINRLELEGLLHLAGSKMASMKSPVVQTLCLTSSIIIQPLTSAPFFSPVIVGYGFLAIDN